MIDTALVLNCPYTFYEYEPWHLDNIKCWLDYFIDEKELHVVATLPTERAEDVMNLTYDKELYTCYPVLSFDTCDRWRAGLSKALDQYCPQKHVYLWSADFDCTEESKTAADKLIDYPEGKDLVVGTIEAVGKKEDIDKFATNPFVENWFPDEFESIKANGFSKPRSELLRFSVSFLEFALSKRWFPTEQTIHLIFQCLWNDGSFEAEPIFFPKIKDDGEARDQPNVIQQVERMEVWMKYMWRDRQSELNRNWWETGEYTKKCKRSFRTAMRAHDILLKDKIDNIRQERRMESCQTMERQMYL